MTGSAYINIPINRWKIEQDIQTINKVDHTVIVGIFEILISYKVCVGGGIKCTRRELHEYHKNEKIKAYIIIHVLVHVE